MTLTPVSGKAQDRIVALDVARGLAVFGMFVAHIASVGDMESTGQWFKNLADGRSSILFAFLAGISLAILTGRHKPYTGVRYLQAKTRIFTRAALLLVIASIISLMNSHVAIILAFYSTWFVLAIPFLKWRPRNLFIAAGLFGLIGPFAALYVPVLAEKVGMNMYGDSNEFVWTTMFTGVYVGVVYMAFVLAGVACGRLDLRRPRIASYMAAIGSSMAIVGYGIAFLLTEFLGEEEYIDPMFTDPKGWTADETGPGWNEHIPWPSLHILANAEPHTGTQLEVLGSGGFAIALVGFLLLAGPIIGKILYPLAAVGSMSLTAYCAHVIIIWAVDAFDYPENDWPLLWLVVGISVCATLWKLFIGRGPVEWIMYRVSFAAARITDDSPTPVTAHSPQSSSPPTT